MYFTPKLVNAGTASELIQSLMGGDSDSQIAKSMGPLLSALEQ